MKTNKYKTFFLLKKTQQESFRVYSPPTAYPPEYTANDTEVSWRCACVKLLLRHELLFRFTTTHPHHTMNHITPNFNHIMGRTELAQLYSPEVQPETAWRRLRACIETFPGLTEQLAAVGYRPNQRFFTPLQIKVITAAIGEP